MNVLESEWLARQLAAIRDDQLFPLLDVGSSTLTFRRLTQPHIESNIFTPLAKRRGVIYHLDMKLDEGVDLVGSLSDDPELRNQVRSLGVRSAIVSNLLEHVDEPGTMAKSVLDVLPSGGYLFVTGPKDYPYHADPIDTMFRPEIEELHTLFPNTTLIESVVLDSGNWRQWNPRERGRTLRRTLVRLATPFYRPANWWALARQSPYLFKHITAFGVVLQKL